MSDERCGPGGREPVHVLVGLIADRENRYLISRRRAGQHLAGAWEFPGGKMEPGEHRLSALQRELAEELGITVRAAEPFLELVHEYPDRSVVLDVWRVRSYSGEPRGLEGQSTRWVHASELGSTGLLPADRPIVDAIVERLCAGAALLPEEQSPPLTGDP